MKKIIILLAIILSGCATSKVQQQKISLSESEALIKVGYKKLSNRNTKSAIVDFDKVIALCSSQYTNGEKKTYASRGVTETLYYMLKSAADKEDAVAVSSTCSDALYLRGYAGLDHGDLDLAEEYVRRAIDMAPVNSMYLSELGHIYHLKHDWISALDIFTKSEESASTYSPPSLKDSELTRAKRGVGYSLIELGKLDEAELKFKECLEINENDQGALKELEYIAQLRSNRPKKP